MDGALRIGVTGHRWFDEPDAVTEQIDEALATLADGCEPRPFEVWSALAEGADRLVVDRARRRAGTRLVAVLPLEPHDYQHDFATQESRTEFRDLLALASSVRVTGSDHTGSRESAYERAGLVVADEADVVIAVWDGEPARGQGGTAEIIERIGDDPHTDLIVVPVTRTGTPS